MMLGRCLTRDIGALGCTTNVTDILQRRCRSRNVCQISVPHEDLDEVNQCPEELFSYLTVDYTCVPSKSSLKTGYKILFPVVKPFKYI